MQINLTTRHGQLSEANQEKLRAKAEKLHRFFERLTAIDAVIDLEDAARPKVDLSVSAEHKHDFKAHAESSSLASAFDTALQKIEQQLRKYKEKVQTRGRNPDARRHESPGED